METQQKMVPDDFFKYLGYSKRSLSNLEHDQGR